MKFKAKSKDFSAAVNAVLAVHDFGDTSDERQACVLTAKKEGLLLESAKLGAFVSKLVSGQLLREGTVGLNAKDLAGMKLKGDVVLDANEDTAKFSDKNTAYRWAVDARAEQDIEEQRSALLKVGTRAKVPFGVFSAGTTFATYASEKKDDYDVQVTIESGRFEYCGIDYYGYGRYEFKDKSVRVRGDKFFFILGNSILAKVLKEVEQEGEVAVGISEDGSIIRLSCPGLDLWHPAVDKRYQDTDEMIYAVTKGKGAQCVCRIQVMQRELKGALDRAAPVKKKNSDSRMILAIDKNKVPSIKQLAQDNVAVCRFNAEDVKVRGETKIPLREKQLREFLKIAPSAMPLTVESWNQKYLRIRVEEKPGLVDYMIALE